MNPDIVNLIKEIHSMIAIPFYKEWNFIISIIIGLIGAFFSIFAFLEAKKAKEAATEAGTTVKIQTITIELAEIVQRLDILDVNIDFPTARDLLNEISRKIKRLISPFELQKDLSEKIRELKKALIEAKQALNEVRPSNDSIGEPVPNAVYYATENYFSAISGLVADLMGLFEKRTIDLGD